MLRIIINIIIGIGFIIGGLSGKLVLRGTNSSMAIIVVGAGLIIYGVVQIIIKNLDESEEETIPVNKEPENEIKTNITEVSNESAILSMDIDDVTKETIKGMFVEEAYGFVSEKYNVSVKEAKKIVKEIKSKNN